MTDTLRVTTARRDGAARVSHIQDSSLKISVASRRSGLSQARALAATRQGQMRARKSLPRFPVEKRRLTFEEILAAVRPANIGYLKDRAILADSIARITVGPSRRACYCVKDRAINSLLKHRAAFLDVLDLSVEESAIGISPSGQREVVHKDLELRPRTPPSPDRAVAMNNGNNSTTRMKKP